MMSGSATSDMSHAPSSTRWVSRPLCARFPAISMPSGVAAMTTTFFTLSSILSNSIARLMFFT